MPVKAFDADTRWGGAPDGRYGRARCEEQGSGIREGKMGTPERKAWGLNLHTSGLGIGGGDIVVSTYI